MKTITFLVICIYATIICDCQTSNKQFETFNLKFKITTLPITCNFPEILKKESYNIQIDKSDIEKNLSKKEDFFYGPVDREGYSQYKYYYGYRFYKKNVICLLYPSSKFGDQFLLATYLNNGYLIDSLTVGMYFSDYLGVKIQNFSIQNDFKIYIDKVEAIIEKKSKYDKKEKKFRNAIYKGNKSKYIYQINDNGKIIIVDFKEEKNINLNIIRDSIKIITP